MLRVDPSVWEGIAAIPQAIMATMGPRTGLDFLALGTALAGLSLCGLGYLLRPRKGAS